MDISNRVDTVQQTLQAAFGFEAFELELNRSGKLSGKQVARLAIIKKARAKSANIAQVVFGVLVGLLFGVALYVHKIEVLNREAKLVFLGAIMLMVVVLFLSLVYEFLSRRPLMTMKLSYVGGVVRTHTKQFDKHYSPVASESYFFNVEGRTYQLESFEQSEALVTGSSYCFYFVKNPALPIILSVERSQ